MILERNAHKDRRIRDNHPTKHGTTNSRCGNADSCIHGDTDEGVPLTTNVPHHHQQQPQPSSLTISSSQLHYRRYLVMNSSLRSDNTTTPVQVQRGEVGCGLQIMPPRRTARQGFSETSIPSNSSTGPTSPTLLNRIQEQNRDHQSLTNQSGAAQHFRLSSNNVSLQNATGSWIPKLDRSGLATQYSSLRHEPPIEVGPRQPSCFLDERVGMRGLGEVPSINSNSTNTTTPFIGGPVAENNTSHRAYSPDISSLLDQIDRLRSSLPLPAGQAATSRPHSYGNNDDHTLPSSFSQPYLFRAFEPRRIEEMKDTSIRHDGLDSSQGEDRKQPAKGS